MITHCTQLCNTFCQITKKITNTRIPLQKPSVSDCFSWAPSEKNNPQQQTRKKSILQGINIAPFSLREAGKPCPAKQPAGSI